MDSRDQDPFYALSWNDGWRVYARKEGYPTFVADCCRKETAKLIARLLNAHDALTHAACEEEGGEEGPCEFCEGDDPKCPECTMYWESRHHERDAL